MPRCTLCLEENDAAGLRRVAGIEVCAACLKDPCPRSNAARGWAAGFKQTTEHRGSANKRRVFVTFVGVCVPGAEGLTLLARRRTFMDKVAGWFGERRGIRTGDPVFDAAVCVTTPRQDPVQRVLALEGAQSALMDLLGDARTIEILRGEIRVSATSTVEKAPTALCVEACALAHHVSTSVTASRADLRSS